MKSPHTHTGTLLLAVCVAAWATVWLTGRAAAHGGVAAKPGVIGAVTVLLGTAGVGLSAGLYSLSYGLPGSVDSDRGSVAIGVATSLVGVSILGSVLSHPMAVVGTGLFAGAAYVVLDSRDGHTHDSISGGEVTAIATAVLAHRVVEGAILGSLLVSGQGLAVVTAVLVAVHTAVEMVVISGYYRRADARRRGVVTVCAIHVCFVGAAVATAVAVQTVPSVFRVAVMAVAGAVLIVIGLRECSNWIRLPRISGP